ncbi:MAG: mercuric transporter MerT family protein [bacterium]
MKLKELFKLTGLPVLAASLCCLSPLILVAFGLSTATFSASLADSLYGDYRWAFRVVGLMLLAWSLVLYFRRQKGICTLDEVKKRRQEIVNVTLLALIVAIVGYSIFLYVVVHYAGLPFGIWE